MPSPFPGIDPYLQPFWGDVHHSLVVYLADELNQSLPQHCRASLDRRENFHPRDPYHESDPFRQYFIEIVDRWTNTAAVALIEVLIPINKMPGHGREQFKKMQSDRRGAKVNRIVLDLIRGGERVFEPPIGLRDRTGYFVVTYPGDRPHESNILAIDLRDPLPVIGVPLRPGEPEVPVALQPLMDRVYRSGRFPIDYRIPPEPPLEGDDAVWAKSLIEKTVLTTNG
jgi:hypothetical protein